ncbi:uncharacterized protein O3C94_018236 [Discoglossus pictus]
MVSSKMVVGIFSRESQVSYNWLISYLRTVPDVGGVLPVYISNSSSQIFREDAEKCSFAIIYHSKRRGRVNITDVTDSLYDYELKHLYNVQGKDKVLVVIDDLDDSGPGEKDHILQNQPSIGRLARALILFSEKEKTRVNPSGSIMNGKSKHQNQEHSVEMINKLKEITQIIRGKNNYAGSPMRNYLWLLLLPVILAIAVAFIRDNMSTLVQEVSPQIQEVSPQIQEVSPQIQELSTQVEEVLLQDQEVSSFVQEESTQVQKVSPQVNETSPQVQEASSEVQEASSQVSEVLPSVQEVSPQVTEVSMQVLELSHQVKEVSLQILEVSRQVKEVSLQVKEVTTQMKEVTTQMKEVSLQVQKVSLQVKEVSSQVQKSSPQVQEASHQVQEASAQVQEASPQVQEASAQVQELSPQVQEIPSGVSR